MNESIVNLLSQTELFAPCGEKLLREIGEFCSLRRFSQGSHIFRAGDLGNALFIVKSGGITVNRREEGGGVRQIALFISGDSFGEMDMMMETPRNAEARALGDSELIQFPGEGRTLQDLFRAHPPAGARLLHSFLQRTAGRIRKSNAILRENSPWVQEMRNQVYRDKLTGIYNKTYLEEALPPLLKEQPLALLMVKPDNFKEINDTYGHEKGDETLIVYAAALNRRVEEGFSGGAFVCRYAGNELGCVFPGMDREGAFKAAEELRSFVNGLDVTGVTGGRPFTLSASVGIALFPEHGAAGAELIAAAHELPLIGRGRGGNRILFPEDK
jgi:diguanylate cyclase (GGDEF)-like protein